MKAVLKLRRQRCRSKKPVFGRWLTNWVDPTSQGAKNKHYYNCNSASTVMMDLEWTDHLAYIARHLIGPPAATKDCSVESLKGMNLVGLYMPV